MRLGCDGQKVTKVKVESGLWCKFEDGTPEEERELHGRVTGRCDSKNLRFFSDGYNYV